MATAALPPASVNPAAPSVSLPVETLAAPLPPGDLPKYPLTDVDQLLDTIMAIKSMPTLVLICLVADDQEWQTYLRWLIVYPSQQYDLPRRLANAFWMVWPLCWT